MVGGWQRDLTDEMLFRCANGTGGECITPLAAFIASGEMAVAYFMVHFPRGFFPSLNGGDLAVTLCFFSSSLPSRGLALSR